MTFEWQAMHPMWELSFHFYFHFHFLYSFVEKFESSRSVQYSFERIIPCWRTSAWMLSQLVSSLVAATPLVVQYQCTSVNPIVVLVLVLVLVLVYDRYPPSRTVTTPLFTEGWKRDCHSCVPDPGTRFATANYSTPPNETPLHLSSRFYPSMPW